MEPSDFMREALRLARQAADAGEVPVGAVVARGDDILGRGQDRKIEMKDPTAHAEILALRDAARQHGDWRLDGCELFVTLEPCPMCAGAALLARVARVTYGASNEKFGAVETHIHMLEYPRWNHRVEVIRGLLEAECAEVLKVFFSGNVRNPGTK